MSMQRFKLNTGHQIPSIGFGTFLVKPQNTQKSVSTALRLGYRHIDTAQLYGNEREVGQAVSSSGIPRDEIFVTTKLWESEWGYRAASGAIQDRLATLDFEYIDLLLLHTPGNPRLRSETWKAMEDAHSQGHVRSIGVSNFGVGHIEKLLKSAKTVPAVNQIELSPFLQRQRLVDYCTSKGILLEAYSPLLKGSASKLQNKTLQQLAGKHKVTAAQILLRWSVQKGFVPLPKASSEERMAENFDIFDFELSKADMKALDALEQNFVTAWDPSETDPI